MSQRRIVRIVEMGPKWTSKGKDWGIKSTMVDKYTPKELGEFLFNSRQHSMAEHGTPGTYSISFPDGEPAGEFPTK